MKSSPRRSTGVDLIWEIPLAIFSFCFYKGMKCWIGQLFRLYLTFNPSKARHWRILCADTLAMPLSLPVLMTKGPRWNTHAIIGTVGPFPVQETLAVQIEQVDQSAGAWTIAVYRWPDYRTITQLGSAEEATQDNWHVLSLPPGRYSLGVRYYQCTEPIQFPNLKIDGQLAISAQTAPPGANAVYQDLIHRQNGFYLALHYYVFTLLRLRDWFPEAFVQGEYLPVGDPNTTFLYDYVRKSELIQVDCAPQLLAQYSVYLTTYSRASLPIHSCQIQQATTTLPPASHAGFYLIRLRPQATAAPLEAGWIHITLSGQEQHMSNKKAPLA